MSPVFRKIDCLSLPVPDLEAALEFYSEKLGHDLLWRSSTAAALKLPDSNAELVLHTDARPIETDITVESVPEAVRRFSSAGGRIVKEPFEIAIGLCAVIEDPWRNRLVVLDTSKGLLVVDQDKRVVEDG